VSVDGKHVISGCWDKTVIVWSLESGAMLKQLKGHSSGVSSVCMSADGRHVISGSDDKTVIVWSLESGEMLKQLKGHNRGVNSVCVSADGKHVISGSADKTVIVWSLKTLLEVSRDEAFAASLGVAGSKSDCNTDFVGQFLLSENLPFYCLCPIGVRARDSGCVVGASNGAVAVLLRLPSALTSFPPTLASNRSPSGPAAIS
jgi:WD40 repeat protein